ncbi:right-handed parallel beta-helix repeat-containing protein [Bacillus sp. A301a_S52]|nr:right-handed parallel beta-helix repeat-containing protein [Bacillus sp. A301a_S52]
MNKSSYFLWLVTSLSVLIVLLSSTPASVSAQTTLFNESFNGATTHNVFTTDYRSLPSDSSTPMFMRTGGTVTAGSNKLTLNGGRMTIGASTTTDTTSNSTPGGAFDLSKPYKIIINIDRVSGDSNKNFQVYVDNNTVSMNESIHGGASRVYQQSIGNMKTGDLIIEPEVGTANSFIQVRTESDGRVDINSIQIEYLDGSAPSHPTGPTPTQPGIPEGDRTFYVATNGNNNNSGSQSSPFATLDQAISVSKPGDVIVMRDGTYSHDTRITANNSGTSSKPITIVNYPDETPILDFSAQEELAGRDGLRINGDYWHIIGIHLTQAGGNGFRIHGSHNRIERCVAYENRLTGIHLEDGSHNLIMNNDSYRNFNLRGRVGNMSDGFAAKYEDLGPGNVFYGNRSWENSDDGFDFWMVTNTLTLENNWSFGNGNPQFWNHPDFDGGGNGFKLGGNHKPGNHIVKRNMAFDNHGKGFDHNNNTGALTLIHNTAYNNGIRINGRNYDFPNNPSNGQHTFINNISANGQVTARFASNSILQGNSWQTGTVTSNMFDSVDTSLAKRPRKEDGSLPDIHLFVPRSNTFLIDGGVDIGEPFNGTAPDMGAIETGQ